MEIAEAFNALLKIFSSYSDFKLFLIMIVSILHSILLLGFAYVGFIRRRSLSKFAEWIVLFCAVTVLGLVLVTGAAGQARFRVPAEPFLAVLAGFGFMDILGRRDSNQAGRHLRPSQEGNGPLNS
jgi:hypothetical protein